MRKEDQLIMVVEREKLFEDDYFEGFSSVEKTDFQKRILNNFKYIKRGAVENDENYQQPIGYIALIDRKKKRIFAYQRAMKEKDSAEKRLHGKWSLGVGGHIDKGDEEEKNPIVRSVLREIEEEVEIRRGSGEAKIVGYINDESDSVGRVHFGVLYTLEVFGEVLPKGKEINKGEMKAIEEIEKITNDPFEKVESWSKIFLEVFKKNNL